MEPFIASMVTLLVIGILQSASTAPKPRCKHHSHRKEYSSGYSKEKQTCKITKEKYLESEW